jgi:hypothetical protein
VAVPIALAPGAPVTLTGAETSLVLASGVVVTTDGQELARGTMIGPVGEEFDGPVATARTPVRLFSVRRWRACRCCSVRQPVGWSRNRKVARRGGHRFRAYTRLRRTPRS